jgi:large conductance mechanosensitive channel
MLKEFKAFAFKGNVIDLAVGVVIGVAFTGIVKAIVDGLIMPVVGSILPGGDWRAWTVWKLQLGMVLGAILEFLIIAFVLFVVVTKVIGALAKKPPAAPPEPTLAEVRLTEIRDLLKAGR